MMWIETTEEDKELWNWIGFLRDSVNAARIIRRRVNNSFFLPTPPSLVAPLTHAHVQKAGIRIASSIRQAEEQWRAAGSSDVTPVSLPIVLFYGAESLASALIFATFDSVTASKTHGLQSRNRHRKVLIQNTATGLFRRFHECYSRDSRLYGTTWNLKQLLSVNIDIYAEFSLGYRAKPHINMEVDHIDHHREVSRLKEYAKPYRRSGKVRPFHPLDYRFLTLYILSSFARYEPTEWIVFLNSPEGFTARAFLAKTYRRFPNLFLNAMWGDEFIFGPGARLAGSPQLPTI